MIKYLTYMVGSEPLWNWILQALGVVCAYVGAVLNAKLNIKGFFIWLLSNIVLGLLHALTGLWLLLILDLLFFRINVLGIIKWTRLNPEKSPSWLQKLVIK